MLKDPCQDKFLVLEIGTTVSCLDEFNTDLKILSDIPNCLTASGIQGEVLIVFFT